MIGMVELSQVPHLVTRYVEKDTLALRVIPKLYGEPETHEGWEIYTRQPILFPNSDKSILGGTLFPNSTLAIFSPKPQNHMCDLDYSNQRYLVLEQKHDYKGKDVAYMKRILDIIASNFIGGQGELKNFNSIEHPIYSRLHGLISSEDRMFLSKEQKNAARQLGEMARAFYYGYDAIGILGTEQEKLEEVYTKILMKEKFGLSVDQVDQAYELLMYMDRTMFGIVDEEDIRPDVKLPVDDIELWNTLVDIDSEETPSLEELAKSLDN
jgi:hypothetical protein